jgi:hypothetical protein
VKSALLFRFQTFCSCSSASAGRNCGCCEETRAARRVVTWLLKTVGLRGAERVLGNPFGLRREPKIPSTRCWGLDNRKAPDAPRSASNAFTPRSTVSQNHNIAEGRGRSGSEGNGQNGGIGCSGRKRREIAPAESLLATARDGPDSGSRVRWRAAREGADRRGREVASFSKQTSWTRVRHARHRGHRNRGREILRRPGS